MKCESTQGKVSILLTGHLIVMLLVKLRIVTVHRTVFIIRKKHKEPVK